MVAILIPARLAATRLPNKPLLDIGGAPMIVRVWQRAVEADIGPVVVAAGDQEIVDAIEQSGGRAVLTPPDLPSGSDRIWHALGQCPDIDDDIVVNLQGDLPLISAQALQATAALLHDTTADISTLAAEIIDEAEKTDPNVVKVIAGFSAGSKAASALYFTRATAPTGEGPLYHHIGLYGYRRDALRRFISLEPSLLEKRERLEQLRALENGMKIMVGLVDEVPVGVDTQEDLTKVRAIFEQAALKGTAV